MVNKVTKLFCMTDDYRKFFDNFSMYKDDRLAIIIFITLFYYLT